MSHEVATIKGNLNEERCFTAPLRIWEFVFLFVFAAGIIGAACWQSSKSYLSNDELVTAVVVSNPHFSEMWNAIRHGGELNPPLFFVIEWVVAQTLGSSDLALRIIPVVSLALAGWVLFFTLRPLTGPRIAAVTSSSLLRYDLLDCQQAAPMIPAANTNRKTNSQILNGAVKHRSSFRFPLMVATSWLIVVQSLTRWV